MDASTVSRRMAILKGQKTMEYWDAVDVHGQKLGSLLIRDEPIPPGMYHHVVEILVATPGGHVFVTQRAPNKTFPLLWEITGGSVLAGEDVFEGAVRELKEETGIQIEPSDLIHLHTTIGDCYLFHSYLTIRSVSKAEIRMQEGETVDWRLLTWDEFFEWMATGRIAQTIGERMEPYLDSLKRMLIERGISNIATAFKK
jgi:8-oxo-dGTP pyrophosphatase MutT (NUDIX family)